MISNPVQMLSDTTISLLYFPPYLLEPRRPGDEGTRDKHLLFGAHFHKKHGLQHLQGWRVQNFYSQSKCVYLITYRVLDYLMTLSGGSALSFGQPSLHGGIVAKELSALRWIQVHPRHRLVMHLIY